MPTTPDWMVRLQRWPIGVIGEFTGTRSDKDPQARAARRWLRRLLMTQAEQLAIFAVLMDKGLVTKQEYQDALQNAAHTLCVELEAEFPGLAARDNGVDIDKRFIETAKDWPK